MTVEITIRLSREVEANSSDEAERLADNMQQEYDKGETAHIIGAK